MASTNSTKKSDLNSCYVADADYHLYANEIWVTTGNLKDSGSRVVNGKYDPNTKFNNTYTLQTTTGAFEESGRLLNYYDPVLVDDYTYVYGHPDKWIYDIEQKYNNCGVVSALNILSMAGKIDVAAPTKAELEKYNKPYTVVIGENPITGEKVTETRSPKYDMTSTEEELTLYAIKHDYAIHSKDLSNYKSVDDIKLEDGGTYTATVFKEMKLYHDTTHCVTALLNDFGVKADVFALPIVFRPLEEKNVEYKDEEKEEVVGQDDEGKDITVKYDTVSSYVIDAKHSSTRNYSIDSKYGTDTVIFDGLNYSDFENREYVISENGGDLYIFYNDSNYVKIVNYYAEDPKNRSHVEYVQFDNGEKMSIRQFEYSFTHYTSKLIDSNRVKYGDLITALNTLVGEGKGVVLTGDAYALNGTKSEGRMAPHAISLVGAKTAYLLKGEIEINNVSKNTLSDIVDEDGFYVVDSGRWLPQTGGAQFIDCETMYQFVGASNVYEYGNSAGVYKHTAFTPFVATLNEIRSWADNLNLVGNDRRNTLLGNEGNNILKGGSNVDNLYGLGGNDTLYGGSSNDWLSGGAGNNVLNGGSGNDTYVFEDKDDNGARQVINPGKGSDRLRFENINVSDLNYINSDGNLIIDYSDNRRINVKNYFSKEMYSSIVKLDDEKTIQKRADDDKDHAYDFVKLLTDNGINYELDPTKANSVKGTKFKDFITTTKYDDTIKSGAGHDSINAVAGDDVINTGAGNDRIVLGYGNKDITTETGKNKIYYKDGFSGYDTIHSGKGKDYIYLTSVSRDDLLYSKKGNNLVVTYDKDTGSSITITDYFSKKGNSSVKFIKLSNGDYLDLNKEYSSLAKKCAKNKTSGLFGGNGHDTLRSGSGSDVLIGGRGDDVIMTGRGSDEVTGGLGNDALYAQGGNDTFIYESMYDGNDTIYAEGRGNVLIDMSAIDDLSLNGRYGFKDGYQRYENGSKNYGYSKSGNDLVINYGKSIDQESMSSIRLANYFKNKNKYTLYTADGALRLKKATIYFEGKLNGKNKLTGTRQNDLIYGGKLKDTIKGGIGNDIIVGGKGSDVITAGAGHNKVIYNNGDGIDTINLTRKEKLDIVMDSRYDADKLSYNISNKDLVVSYNGSKKLVLKNFGANDVTGSKGHVKLYVGDKYVENLRTGVYLPKYKSFSSKKLSYTGGWHSEDIDASKLTKSALAGNAGVKINGKGGNDIITGSQYNDTLYGGSGKDIIAGGSGKNTIDGNNGKDTYILFDGVKNEKSVIKDTGSSGADTALIYTDVDSLKVWFNVTNKGKSTGDFTVKSADKNNNSATLKGVEVIKSVSGSETYTYNYKDSELRQEVAAWLNGSGHKYSDAASAFKNATVNQQNELMAIFNKSEYWTPSA